MVSIKEKDIFVYLEANDKGQIHEISHFSQFILTVKSNMLTLLDSNKK